MNPRILIIDDEPQDRKGMTIALNKAGYQDIVYAETGKAGVQQAKELNPDIVVIDVVLPDGDGFGACEQLKSSEQNACKILMITGHLDAVNAQRARTSGADEIIEKKAGFPDIAGVIHEILTKGSRYRLNQ